MKVVESKVPKVRLEYTLTIPNATVLDSGEYECVVTSAVDDITEVKKINMTVHGKCEEIISMLKRRDWISVIYTFTNFSN